MQGADFQKIAPSCNYNIAMKWHERIQRRMDELGITKADLQRMTGLSYDNINKWLRGGVEKPRGNAIKILGKALDLTEVDILFGDDIVVDKLVNDLPGSNIIHIIPKRNNKTQKIDHDEDDKAHSSQYIYVLGEVAAGMWKDVRTADPYIDKLPVSDFFVDGRYPIYAQFDLIVKGNSLDKLAPDGFHLRCLDIYKAGVRPKDKDIVIIERRNSHFLCETTAKRYRVIEGGAELWPESTDPRWQEPILVLRGGEDSDTEIRITAVVLHVYNPNIYRR